MFLFDQYYYEPHTRRKFRSLASVQKYLAQEAGDHDINDITETTISKDGNTNTVSSNFICCNFLLCIYSAKCE